MKNTEIIVVMDRSGSMQGIASDMEGGFKTFIEKQKAEPGEARVTLAQFDDQYELLYAGKPIAEVAGISLVPRNSTALLDAIGLTIATQRERIEKEKWAQLVCMVIITDGLENASKEYDQETIKRVIKDCESVGWEFIYMGANQDAIAVATRMGMKMGSGQNYQATQAGTQQLYASAHATVASHRSK